MFLQRQGKRKHISPRGGIAKSDVRWWDAQRSLETSSERPCRAVSIQSVGEAILAGIMHCAGADRTESATGSGCGRMPQACEDRIKSRARRRSYVGGVFRTILPPCLDDANNVPRLCFQKTG